MCRKSLWNSDFCRRMDQPPLQLSACRLGLVLALIIFGACGKLPEPLAVENGVYWTCSMHPSVHAASEGKCPICGMALVPVTRSKKESFKPSTFMVSAQRQQQFGVTYAEVRPRPIKFDIRAVGMLAVDQARVYDCSSRVDGYIEQLQVTSPGEGVMVGQPLMTIYSPDLLGPEQELANLLKVQISGSVSPASMDQLIDSARHRLQLLNVSPMEIAELERTSKPTDRLVFRSPFEGIVSEAPMKVGMNVKRGETLIRVINLASLWLWVSFYEDEVGLLREGQPLTGTLPALQNRSFEGKIDAISPVIDPVKRTAMVRIDVPNPNGQLRPGMYANVVVEIDAGEDLAIPAEAVLPTGSRMLVFVDLGSGRLEPRFIQVGRLFVDFTNSNQERYYQITSGLKIGERIVSSANFLIDAEAQVQGALRNFGADQ
jgi:membrane fusion protein, copper/silver efflux system